MEYALDVCLKIISYLPKFISFWLYSPQRVKSKIDVHISAREGSVELWCDKYNASFNIDIEFTNNNPFPIEIDRIQVSGYLHAANIKAVEIFGTRIECGKKSNIYLRGKLDENALILINNAPSNESLRLEVRAIIMNKYNCIRDFTHNFDRLMCKFYNKNLKAS